ncbi:hypothetical protein K435DRAFT_308353 [Dendrothele bispora CBS 962.96]|uniref:Uncharacterized protein n=1 Tax=Dendrothele bispora (strain CBS 962.96) TaxID=1314807 RepID=A0A4S8MJJ9_DENBC|nr:hypothetical protein K435DRAFT_308353 [Dendrothele bispora CBS 962.96]
MFVKTKWMWRGEGGQVTQLRPLLIPSFPHSFCFSDFRRRLVSFNNQNNSRIRIPDFNHTFSPSRFLFFPFVVSVVSLHVAWPCFFICFFFICFLYSIVQYVVITLNYLHGHSYAPPPMAALIRDLFFYTDPPTRMHPIHSGLTHTI